MIQMPEAGFKYYALHYLNLWISQDQPCCHALAGHHREEKLEALAAAAADYGIARTLPKRDGMDKGPERYGPVLKIIERQKRENFRNSDLPRRVERVNRQIKLQYASDHQVLSLTTKFLWLKLKSPIIIYDSRARTALKVRPNDIEEFYRRWREEFSGLERAIEKACASLGKMYEYTKNPKKTNSRYVTRIAAKRWFRERIFDVYLWHLGEPERQGS
jgi:hypothetical protein